MSQSYTPLYRKYRPQTFADLVGQEVVTKALCNAIEMGKIAHAYLFTGSRGTGKTSAARILAKSLNCIEGPTATPCGKCANCIDIANGSAIDVQEIDAASNNGVEDARDIIEKVQFVPVSGKYKIFIIDEVHMLSNAAFNTLLKTLEEPPKNLVFILATTESHKVLETIVSRCQRFDFRKIKMADITKRLEYIAKQEKIKISKDAIELIAQKASGGLRDAIALLDQASVLGLGGNEISVDDILSISGAISQDDLFAITDSLAKKQPDKLIELLDKIISQGNEPLLILRELVGYFRNLLLVKTAGGAEKVKDLLVVSESALSKLDEQSKDFEAIEIAQIIEKLAEYEVMLKNTTNQMMWIEVILISILHRQDIKVIKDLEQRVSALEAALSGGAPIKAAPQIAKPTISAPPPKIEQKPEPKPAPRKAPPKEFEPIEGKAHEEATEQVVETKPTASSSSGAIKDDWVSILKLLDGSVTQFYSQMATPVEISNKNVIIAIKSDFWLQQIKTTNKLSQLEDGVKKFFGKEVGIRLVTLDEKNTLKKNLKQTSEEPKQEEKPIKQAKNREEEPEDLDKIEKLETEIVSTKKERTHFSDTEDMVMDLFQGKIIE